MTEDAPRQLSHSYLITYVECPRKFYYRYVRDLESTAPPSLPLEVGRIMHKVLYAYYSNDKDLEAALTVLREVFDLRPFGDDDYMSIGHLETIMRNYHDKYINAPYTLIKASEEEIEGEIAGYPFIGIPDVVMKYNGELHVMDHKTTLGWLGDRLNNRVKMQYQLRIYALLLVDQGYEVAGGLLNAIYCGKYASKPKSKAQKFEREQFPYTSDDYLKAEAWVTGVAFEIERATTVGSFPQCPGDQCSHCEFQDLCAGPTIMIERKIAANYKKRERD